MPASSRAIRPRKERPDDALHVDECFDPLGMALGPLEPQRRPPIVHDQNDVARDAQRVEPRVEVPLMITPLERVALQGLADFLVGTIRSLSPFATSTGC